MQFTPTGNIILVHKGALGDFVLGWPCLLSIRSAFPRACIYWAGRDDFLHWLNPMKISKLPRILENRVSKLYYSSKWPESLDNFRLFWFGIDRVTTSCQDSRLIFLTGVDRSRHVNFRKALFSCLKKYGILPVADWQKVWLGFFGPRKPSEHVLIFPGSGNRKKNWPFKNYLCLADLLRKQGFRIIIVLGPVEQEQGLNIPDFDTIDCQNYVHLQELIKKALFVIGNDCGPMHLAGMFNVPGVALFGPTPPEIWKPQGMNTVKSDMPCAPCSETAAVDCLDPLCMNGITIDQVMELVRKKIINSGLT